MFILEGLPTILVGLVVFSYLDDGPAAAKWLTGEERNLIGQSLDAENSAVASGTQQHLTSFRTAIGDGRLYILAFSWFCFICGVYMISFWLPTLIKELGVSSPLHVGLLVAIPFGLSVVGMIATGIHSDRKLERRWHCAVPALVGALALIGLVFFHGNSIVSFALLCVAAIGINTTVPLFWSVATGYLKGEAAAGGIALINSLGLIGGFVSPFVLGWIRTSTGNFLLGNWLIAALLVAGGVAILRSVRPGRNP
jgi:MFS family permease